MEKIIYKQKSMFRRISIKSILIDTVSLWKRFPLPLVASIVGTTAGIFAIDRDYRDYEEFLVKILLVSILSFFWFVFLALKAERHAIFGAKKALMNLLGVLIIIGYYWYLPEDMDGLSIQNRYRHILYHIILLLGILVVPFWKKKSLPLWRYGERTIIRLFVTGIFSITLFAGVSLSVWSVDYLFISGNFEGEIYGKIWAFVVGIFATWFFLSKYPTDSQKEKFIYPTVLRVFVQYLLVPILTVFFVILYVYTGKIVFTWNWPLGGVAYWVITYSSAALLSFILGYPMRKIAEYVWIKKFFKALFALIIPLTVVLFMAIGIRIEEYGITENRYLVVVMGLWLLGIAVYYLFSKRKKLQVLPLSLALVILLTLFGPWSMFSISARSQDKKLGEYLQNIRIPDQERTFSLLENGKIIRSEFLQQPPSVDPLTIEGKTYDGIRSRIEFLVNHDEKEKLQKYLPIEYSNFVEKNWRNKDEQNLEGIKGEYECTTLNCRRQNEVQAFMNYLNIVPKYTDKYDSATTQPYYSFHVRENQGVNIQGYKNMVRFSLFSSKGINDVIKYVFDGKEITLERVQNNIQIKISGGETLIYPIDSLITDLAKKYGGESRTIGETLAEDMTVVIEGKETKAKILFLSIFANREKESMSVESVEGYLFLE